jgi:RNase P subunit RPR2
MPIKKVTCTCPQTTIIVGDLEYKWNSESKHYKMLNIKCPECGQEMVHNEEITLPNTFYVRLS